MLRIPQLSTVQHCHDGNESGRVDLIPGSKTGCDRHRKNPLLAENRRYAAMNFGHKVRDTSNLIAYSESGIIKDICLSIITKRG